jgi:hypothetical protein
VVPRRSGGDDPAVFTDWNQRAVEVADHAMQRYFGATG